jgi:hypothetical protein
VHPVCIPPTAEEWIAFNAAFGLSVMFFFFEFLFTLLRAFFIARERVVMVIASPLAVDRVLEC